MSGSSLDGLDIVFVELDDSGGAWHYEVKASACIEYDDYWLGRLKSAGALGAYEYLALDAAYGKFTGNLINSFIHHHHLHHQVQLIASHGHTVFHDPSAGFTAQLGNGAAIAAITGINVVSNLRAMDVALGGQGAPIVPVGEKLLWKGFDYFLNIGGIANISVKNDASFTAFDICPANRVLNLIAQLEGRPYDENGTMAARGKVNQGLLTTLNGLDYYAKPYPKSLANEFGTEVVFPLIQSYNLHPQDALCTYAAHIAQQLQTAVVSATAKQQTAPKNGVAVFPKKMLVTGGGAFNSYLVERIAEMLEPLNIEVEMPAAEIVKYKEAVIMALLGVLRWREQNTVLSSVTGASRSSIGGAVWMGQDA